MENGIEVTVISDDEEETRSQESQNPIIVITDDSDVGGSADESLVESRNDLRVEVNQPPSSSLGQSRTLTPSRISSDKIQWFKAKVKIRRLDPHLFNRPKQLSPLKLENGVRPCSLQTTPKNEVPTGCKELHHEVELDVVIGKTGVDIPESQAMEHVGGYALALDMTARDLQSEAKKLNYPWLFAKGFGTATPISNFILKSKIPDPQNVRLWLKVDGGIRQDGNTKDMIFKIPYLISYISQNMTLEEGDLILTGTPKGVSAVKPGQTIVCGLEDKVMMKFPITQ